MCEAFRAGVDTAQGAENHLRFLPVGETGGEKRSRQDPYEEVLEDKG